MSWRGIDYSRRPVYKFGQWGDFLPKSNASRDSRSDLARRIRSARQRQHGDAASRARYVDMRNISTYKKLHPELQDRFGPSTIKGPDAPVYRQELAASLRQWRGDYGKNVAAGSRLAKVFKRVRANNPSALPLRYASRNDRLESQEHARMEEAQRRAKGSAVLSKAEDIVPQLARPAMSEGRRSLPGMIGAGGAALAAGAGLHWLRRRAKAKQVAREARG